MREEIKKIGLTPKDLDKHTTEEHTISFAAMAGLGIGDCVHHREVLNYINAFRDPRTENEILYVLNKSHAWTSLTEGNFMFTPFGKDWVEYDYKCPSQPRRFKEGIWFHFDTPIGELDIKSNSNKEGYILFLESKHIKGTELLPRFRSMGIELEAEGDSAPRVIYNYFIKNFSYLWQVHGVPKEDDGLPF